MAKDIKVAKAFQSTDRDTKEVQVVQTRGGEMHKYMVQFEGRNDWIGILKKPGNKVSQGDVLYGNIIEDGQWGKPEFKSEQRPFEDGLSSPSPQQPTSQGSGELEEKVDYLISLFENFLEHYQGKTAAQKTADVSPTADDMEKPLDLSDIPY